MAKRRTGAGTRSKGTIIGAIGGTMIGAAILLFVVTMILNNLKATADPNPNAHDNATHAARNESWAAFNASVSTIQTILVVCVILLAVMGIVLIGSQMIAVIGGGWGG